MKAINIIILFAMLSASQVYSQQFFSNVTLVNSHRHEMIRFSLPKEVNIMYYRIEASNDTNEFDIIGRVASTGNSMLPKTYHYELYGADYKYYRIGITGMDGSLHYSQLIQETKPAPHVEPIFILDSPMANQQIANLKGIKL